MRLVLALTLSGLALITSAEERRMEVDPNTKIEGGADLRGSGAGAGATTLPNNASDKSVAKPDKDDPDKDKPISERKPQEREPPETTIPDTDSRRDTRSVP